jgi:predicted hotdog family 3-hydroxylacyl-ACP dehydratase
MQIDVAALVPHQGAMCLLDCVESWSDDHILCRASSHRRPDHPLREGSRLRALCAIEYGAQAIAAHAGLLGRSAGSKPATGFLAAVRDVVVSVAFLDEIKDSMMIRAQVRLRHDTGHIYDITVTAGQQTILTGRLSVIVPCGTDQAVPSPEER